METMWNWLKPEEKCEKEIKAPAMSTDCDENRVPMSSLKDCDDNLESTFVIVPDFSVTEETDQRLKKMEDSYLPQVKREEPSHAQRLSEDECQGPHRDDPQAQSNSSNTVKPISDGFGLEEPIWDWFGPEQDKTEKKATSSVLDQNSIPVSTSSDSVDDAPKSLIVEQLLGDLNEEEARIQEIFSSTNPSGSRLELLFNEFDENARPPVELSEPNQNGTACNLEIPPIIPEVSGESFAQFFKKLIEEEEEKNSTYKKVYHFAEFYEKLQPP